MRQVYTNAYRMQGESMISASDNIIPLADRFFQILGRINLTFTVQTVEWVPFASEKLRG